MFYWFQFHNLSIINTSKKHIPAWLFPKYILSVKGLLEFSCRGLWWALSVIFEFPRWWNRPRVLEWLSQSFPSPGPTRLLTQCYSLRRVIVNPVFWRGVYRYTTTLSYLSMLRWRHLENGRHSICFQCYYMWLLLQINDSYRKYYWNISKMFYYYCTK